MLQFSVFQADYVPAKGPENRIDSTVQTFANDAIETLPVIINDPPSVAQLMFPSFLQTLIDVAFIEFCVTRERNHAAR